MSPSRDRKKRAQSWRARLLTLLIAAAAVPPAFVPAGASEGIDRPAPNLPAANLPAQQPPADPDAFTLTGLEASAERDAPELCAHFSHTPDPEQPAANLATLTAEEGTPVPVNLSRRGRSLCLGGLEHGKRYRVTLSGDLKAVNGRTLGEAVDRWATVAERRPSLAFRDAGFLVTRTGDGRSDGDLALRSVNVAAATLRLLRLADADGLERAYFEAGDPALVDRLAKDAKEVWSGAIALGPLRNRPLNTPVPLEAVAGKLEPGVYVAVAQAEGGDERTQQWFIVSDLGVITVTGEDGLLIFARSRATAAPLEGVSLKVAARDRSEAAVTRTAADGLARIDAAQLAGVNERAPQVLLARRGANVAVVELSGPRNALGVEADDHPFQRSRLDAFVGVDRSVYAPGDTVRAVALLRDTDGREAAGESLTVELRRPDGALHHREVLSDAGGGGYVFSLRLPETAPAGDWRLSLHEEAGGEAVGDVVLRVDDARPLGLNLTLDAAAAAGGGGDGGDAGAAPPSLRLNVRVLTAGGRPAAGVAGQVFVSARRPAAADPAFPGFSFAQDLPPGERKLIGGFVADAEGRAALDVAFPDGLPFRSAFDAVVEAEATVAGAAAARAQAVLPYRPRQLAIGLRPRFEGGGAPDGATVAFDVVAVDGATGKAVEARGLVYELTREESAFEWFENQGRWDYRMATRDRHAAGGALDVGTGGPAVISEPVGAGRYRLEVRDPVSGAVASHRFAAGWWMSPQAGARPDRVEVSAIRPGPRAEGKAWVFIRPPYASEVLILVADRRVRRAETRAIGPDGAFIEIPADYGARAGAHVAAVAFASPDPAYRGPQRRAAGSVWLPAVDGARRLPAGVKTETPENDGGETVLRLSVGDSAMRPQGKVHAVAALLPAGAADDALGDPAQSFFGEQPLGVSLRDVYGKLISPPPRRVGARDSARAVEGRRPGALWISPVQSLGEVGEAALPLPPLAAPPGDYRIVMLAWDEVAMGRAEARLTLSTPNPAASLAPAAPTPPPPWRRIAVAEVAPGAIAEVAPDAAAPALETPSGDNGAGLWLMEPAASPDFDLAEAAGRPLTPTPPVGAHAAAARLMAVAAMTVDGDLSGRIARAALDELSAARRSDGAFAAWSPAGPADPWLTAFALDAMERWRRGLGQPADSLTTDVQSADIMASDARSWLRRWWDGCWSDAGNLSACAYALALLTGDKKLDGGAATFFSDGFAAQLPSELARAHLAVAFDNAGDRRQAEAAFARVAGGRRVDAATRDFGSATRDAAGAAALMAERKAPAEALNAAVARLQRTRATAYALNDQESAWLLTAARALSAQQAADFRPTLTASPRNALPVPARFSLLGPASSAEGEEGGRLTLRLTDLSGHSVDPATVTAGDFVAVEATAVFPAEDRLRVMRFAATAGGEVLAVTPPAVSGGADKNMASLLRGRLDRVGVAAAAATPPGVSVLKFSWLVKANGPGEMSASLETMERGGRILRLTAQPTPIGDR